MASDSDLPRDGEVLIETLYQQATQLVALQAVVGALIDTHPDLSKLATAMNTNFDRYEAVINGQAQSETAVTKFQELREMYLDLCLLPPGHLLSDYSKQS